MNWRNFYSNFTTTFHYLLFLKFTTWLSVLTMFHYNLTLPSRKNLRCLHLICEGDHSFSTSAKSSEKLTSLTPWYSHVRNRVRNVSFSENFANVLNEWSPMVLEYISHELTFIRVPQNSCSENVHKTDGKTTAIDVYTFAKTKFIQRCPWNSAIFSKKKNL